MIAAAKAQRRKRELPIKPEIGYGGLTPTARNQAILADPKPAEIMAAIRGCTVAAHIAMTEGQKSDHAWLMHRINELTEVLVNAFDAASERKPRSQSFH